MVEIGNSGATEVGVKSMIVGVISHGPGAVRDEFIAAEVDESLMKLLSPKVVLRLINQLSSPVRELRDRLRQQLRRGSLLRRGVTKLKIFYYFNRSIIAVQSINQQRWRIFSSSIVSGSSLSRSVKFSSRVLVDVVVFAVFSRSSRSRFAESSSAELVIAISSPQRRTRKKKQLLTQICDFAYEKSQGERRILNLNNRIAVFNQSRVLVNAVFAVFDRDSESRSVEFVSQPSVVDSACVGRSPAIQNSAMVCRLQSVNLFFACVNRSCRGDQPVLDSDFACVDCNRVSAELQIEAEPIKEEPENPLGKSEIHRGEVEDSEKCEEELEF
nr:two-component response regulator ARR22-like [Ipomoea batatas]